ncbi:MAG: translation initiation factor IF-2 [Treponema sp.]|jgi:translation initiation factor IF-2|nr:translation initiation factor IF-2 [Treponema sp.]
MAEEIENTKKPKAELIKRAPNESESPGGESSKNVTGPEHNEKRKVIVVKKRNPAQQQQHGPAKKPQPKVVVQARSNTNNTGTALGEGTGSQDNAAAKETLQNAEQKNRKEENPAADVSKEQKPQGTTGQGEGRVTSMPVTQRPNVVAGRVGGKPVGNRFPKEEGQGGRQHQGPSPFPQRPKGVAGRVGGRFVGPRPEGGGPYNNRQGGGQHPYNNQGFRPNQGPRPPVSGNNQRPGGFGAQRPGGLNRPGGGPPAQNPPVLEGKGTVKKTFKAKKPAYTRKDKRQEREDKVLQTKKKSIQVANPVPKSIEIMEVVSIAELAKKLNLRANDIIHKLMSMGVMVTTINQQIDADTASILASEFGADVKIISLYEETLIKTESDEGAVMLKRPPVVTVMGHVDHGKTKLLDAIRSTDVVSGEFGGITQHIGAYTVDTSQGSITFLDTPGHEAFTRMRARGAQVTDIVVLVVAADDGVMPQTVEAINHAKDAGVPIIVAVNKMDKPEANPDRVKSQLSELGLMPDGWGGQTMFVELSALRKEGIDKLIDAILLEADMLDLKANYDRSAEGKILESRIDHGRGTVATAIIERGTLRIGNAFVAGIWPGKVRGLYNDKGKKVEVATPSMPIEILGFEGVPNAGDPLQIVGDEKSARIYASKRQELKRFEDAKNIKKITLDNLYDTISDGAIQELKVIIKADVQGSAEALHSSLEKLSTKEVRVNVIQALPGAINEGDVDLAIASNALIIGFNVRPVPKAKILADQEKVDIRKYNVIYKAVDEIKLAMEGMLKPDTKEEVIGTVEVRNTFKVPKVGTIAGCYVLTGTVKRSASVNIIRDGIVIHTGKLASLKRFKDDAREVAAGFECGIGFEGFDTIQVGDQLEVFELVEIARKLNG